MDPDTETYDFLQNGTEKQQVQLKSISRYDKSKKTPKQFPQKRRKTHQNLLLILMWMETYSSN